MKVKKLVLTDDGDILCPKCNRPMVKMGENIVGCLRLGHNLYEVGING
jgi:hypothetical protein